MLRSELPPARVHISGDLAYAGGGRGDSIGRKQMCGLGGGHGCTEQKSLRLLAAKAAQHLGRMDRFDPLGRNRHSSDLPRPVMARTIFSLSGESIESTNELSILR